LDVSEGGAKIEIEGNALHMADNAFAPGNTVLLKADSSELKLRNSIYLSVAWYRTRQEGNRSAVGTLGGRFTSIDADDLQALIKHATAAPAAPSAAGPLAAALRANATSIIAVVAASAVAVYLWSQSADLPGKVIDLTQRTAQLEQQVESLRSALHAHTESTRVEPARSEPVKQVSPVAPPVVAAVAPARPVEAPPAARPMGEGRVQYDVAEGINGVELASLERVNTDFVGLMTSKLATPQSVIVELEFRCGLGDGGAPAKCVCRAPGIRVPPNGKAEFLCTPESAIPPGYVEAVAHLRAGE
jgi:hypothetical protein